MNQILSLFKLLYWYLGCQLLLGLLLALLGAPILGMVQIDLRTASLSLLLNLIPIALIVRKYRIPIGRDLGNEWQAAFRNMISGTITGFAMICITLATISLAGADIRIAVSEDTNLRILLFWFVWIMILAFCEEIFFRYVWMKVLGASRRSGMVSSAGFALMHGANSGVSCMALLNIFLFGLLLWTLYQRFTSILLISFLHGGWNYACGFVFGIPVSGNAAPGSLLRTNIVGDSLLSGSGFGIEGSIITAAVVGLGLLITLLIPVPGSP